MLRATLGSNTEMLEAERWFLWGLDRDTMFSLIGVFWAVGVDGGRRGLAGEVRLLPTTANIDPSFIVSTSFSKSTELMELVGLWSTFWGRLPLDHRIIFQAGIALNMDEDTLRVGASGAPDPSSGTFWSACSWKESS